MCDYGVGAVYNCWSYKPIPSLSIYTESRVRPRVSNTRYLRVRLSRCKLSKLQAKMCVSVLKLFSTVMNYICNTLLGSCRKFEPLYLTGNWNLRHASDSICTWHTYELKDQRCGRYSRGTI